MVFSRRSLGSRYGASCGGDSGCDQHQKCVSRSCRCNPEERRFWTGKPVEWHPHPEVCRRFAGEACAICAKEYTVTGKCIQRIRIWSIGSFRWPAERCYKSFQELKTWSAARDHCRAQYADLFTWRNNHDEQFIKPMVHQWATLSQFNFLWAQIVQSTSKKQYLAWAGATITSVNRTVVSWMLCINIADRSFAAHTTKWMDPDGLKLTLQSSQWCDPTSHAGYHELKEPSLGTKNVFWLNRLDRGLRTLPFLPLQIRMEQPRPKIASPLFSVHHIRISFA